MAAIDYRPVSEVDFEQFTTAFNLAYCDYFTPLLMSPSAFRALIARDDLDLDASVTALDSDLIVGTGLLGIRERTGWIGGMGVIPERRRQGIGRQMMYYLLDQARARHLTEIRLEVIEANRGAYGLYRELGFVDSRTLLVLERPPGPLPDLAAAGPTAARPPSQLLAHYERFHATPNCWQRALPSLEALADYLQGWAVLHHEQIAAYAVGWANDHAIRLLDLAAEPGCDQCACGTALLAHLHRENPAAYGSSYNIAENDPVLPAYQALGYSTSFRQIEMRLVLEHP